MSNDDYIYCLAASPNFRKDGLVFAAKKSGLCVSEDKGRTWRDALASLKLSTPVPIAYVTVAFAGETTYVFACTEGQILRSLDAGQTWQSAKLETPAPVVIALAVSPNFAEDGTLLAATLQDGIFRSTDRGVSWTGWNFGLFDPNINALAFVDSQTILAGAQSGVFQSTNAGHSWRELDFAMDCAPVLCLAVSRPGTIFVGTESEGLHVSKDEGKNWKRISQGTVEQIQLDGDERILVLKDGELRRSHNGGKSWQAVHPAPKAVSAISAFTILPGLSPDKNLLVGLANGKVVKP